jgi:PPM family protein phosphatase
MLSAFGLTDTGCQRAANEDRIAVDTARGLFLLADGMGGQRRGEYAAELALSAINEHFETFHGERADWPLGHDPSLTTTRNLMMSAIKAANQRIWRLSQESLESSGMGCTIVAVSVAQNVATIGSVGDSRVYLYRDHKIRSLTQDDSLVAMLVQSGQITPAEVDSHPMRSVLIQAAGPSEDVSPQTIDELLRNGDRLLLSSDGLHGVVSDAGIALILERQHGSEQAAGALIAAARERGGPDNISAIVINYDSD